MIRPRQRQIRRGVSSSTEMVIVLAVMFPAAVILAFMVIKLCRGVYYAMASMIGWPYL